MQDYYAIYTWAMDKQAQMEREAAERRLVRQSPLTLRLRLPAILRQNSR